MSSNYLDIIASNYGLQHIATQIFSHLDFQSLINCQLVSKSLNKFIGESEKIWKIQLKNIEFKCAYTKIDECVVFDSKICDTLNPNFFKDTENETPKVKKMIIKHLSKYCDFNWDQFIEDKNNKICLDCQFYLSPSEYAVFLNNMDFINYVLKVRPVRISRSGLYLCPSSNVMVYHHEIFSIFNTDRINLLCRHSEGEGNDSDDNPLIWAAKENCPQLMKILLSVKPASFSINDRDDKGYTALHYACVNENIEMVKLLLSQPNIDVNVRTYEEGYGPWNLGSIEVKMLILNHKSHDNKLQSQ